MGQGHGIGARLVAPPEVTSRVRALGGWVAVLVTGLCMAVAWSLIAGTVAVLATQGRATVGTYLLGAVFVAAITAAIVARHRKGNRA